ncbi:MAG: hypothetical protein WKF96_25395 [Solirubrobacteraceae bacterium]
MTPVTISTAGRDNGQRRSRPVGYAQWSPRGATCVMLEQITAVLDDHADYWPITPRQVLYRLMGRGQATKQDADRIGEYINRGRRAGLIAWEAIGDGRTEQKFPIVCDDPEAFYAEMRSAASVYQLDRQDGQPVYIEMLVEAAGAVEQVFRTTGHYGVPVLSGSGFVSITALRGIVLRAETRDVPTRILVAGDLDPAGHDIRARVGEDIAAFAENHDADITVETIALTEDQVDELALIRAPLDAKKRKKYPWWPHTWTVELEAVSPDQLAAIVSAAIEELTDADTRQAVIDRETQERADLMRQLEDGER